MLGKSRHAAPVLEQDGSFAPLERLPFAQSPDEGRVREELLEELVHSHPGVIPIVDIEPAFAPLISVCRQLPTSAGQIDNFWLTPDGGIVLGECKLARNPQARREVVAQILDYAGALRAMRYEDLEGAVQQALHDSRATLWSFVSEHTDLDEAQFSDAVERRLNLGQFLLLIIGDGIQEGAEALVSNLQLYAGIHAALALVELSIWKIGNRKLIVPRIPLRTTLVERGIVVVDPKSGVRIEAPPVSAHASSPHTLSEEEFYAKLETNRPGSSALLRPFIDSLGEIGITPEFKKTPGFALETSEDLEASAGYIESNGTAHLEDRFHSAKNRDLPEAGDRYIETIAQAIGGRVKRSDKGQAAVLGRDGRLANLQALLAASALWRDAIAQLVSDVDAKVRASSS